MEENYLRLPNGQKAKYQTYTIKCCEECNSELGRVYEVPVKEAFDRGYASLAEFVKSDGASLIREWLSLIFFKVHLRDAQNRVHMDRRKPDHRIIDYHPWEDLRLIHLICRAQLFSVEIHPSAFGTVRVFRAADKGFDYSDTVNGHGLYLKTHKFGLVYILNDGGATGRMLSSQLENVTIDLDLFQSLEVFARHLTANQQIENRPEFFLASIRNGRKLKIKATTPRHGVKMVDNFLLGKTLRRVFDDHYNNTIADGQPFAERYRELEHGFSTFLINDKDEVLLDPGKLNEE